MIGNTSATTVVDPDTVGDMRIMAGFPLSVDEAVKTAEPIVKALNQDLTLFHVSPAVVIQVMDFDAPAVPYGYRLVYTRNYNGVMANYASPLLSENLNTSPEDASGYNKRYPQESLSIVVGADGIYSIEYSAPQTIQKIESSNAKILPFDEIQKIFDQNIVLTKKEYDTYISIDTIQLGLMRIAKPNSGDYLVIPVWDFYGNYTGASGVVPRTEDEYWSLMGDFPDRSFLTINAIDGSVIDRGTGH
jgi:hypothetical protein